MNIDSNNVTEQDAINQYLSCVQLKLDCETIYSLVKSLQQDGVTGFGVMPYITLTAYTALEILSSNDPQFQIPCSAQIKDIRMKLKIFEDGYSKSKRMLLNIDYLQDQIFKKKLKFNFTKNWNINYNLGIYTDKEKRVVGNTQYNYYLLQENRFLKRSLDEIAQAYSISPSKFDLNKQVGTDCYKYACNCGQFINSVRLGLESFDIPVSVNTKKFQVNYYYADYNTNVKSTLFPQGEEGKATILYLLHILSTINFLLYVLNNYEKDDYGWWLKVNYIVYYYAMHKLTNLNEHFVQNKLITPEIEKLFDTLNCRNAQYLNGTFRNYIMHSKLTNREGNSIISAQNLDRTKLLFGLVETCFDGMNYEELKVKVISEMERISKILSQWLDIQSLNIKPLKD